MNAPKRKRPDKDLITALVGSFSLALMWLGWAAWRYIHRGEIPARRTPASADAYNALLESVNFATIQLPLIVGLGFICIGIIILSGYRKYRLEKSGH